MTPPVTPSKHAATSQQSTTAPDDVSTHTQMADVASDVLRMRRVKQKLDSVLVSRNCYLASAAFSKVGNFLRVHSFGTILAIPIPV